MQLSAMGLLVLGAAVYRLPALLVGAAVALAYSHVFCRLEEQELAQRFGDSWHDLAQSQRRWIPSFRPLATSEPATLWVRRSCPPCWKLGQSIAARNAVALRIRHAEDHHDNLQRLRYERADGTSFDGTSAIGAAMEHIHLGWAMLGWLLRAPVLCHFFQLVADAMGFGPTTTAPTMDSGAA